MQLAFRAKFLPLLYPFMAQRDIRYYLNGICVRPWGDGVLLSATDGHALAMVYDAEGRAERETILQIWPETLRACTAPSYGHWGRGLRALERWVVADNLERKTPILGTERHVFRLVVNVGADYQPGSTDVYVQSGLGEIDGKFPEAWRVVPKSEDLKPGHPGAFQLHLLDRLPRKRGRSGRSNAAKFYSAGDETKAAVIHLPDVPEFIALVMPVRDDRQAWGGRALPSWWDDNLQPIVEAVARKPEERKTA
jgi:hypothetical protein